MAIDVGSIPILTITTFTPLVGAILVAVAPTRYARSLALAVSLVAWVVSLLLLIGFDPQSVRQFQFKEQVAWIPF
ncbi:MAG TPA: hypothetical protein VFP22_09570, partial [Candidatus Limnocylindrales bacterium]|nr:hypothetical protein [Candidatus Limnocylindrales bacterium]